MSAMSSQGPKTGAMAPPPIPIKRSLADAPPLSSGTKRRRVDTHFAPGRSGTISPSAFGMQQSSGFGARRPQKLVFTANRQGEQQPREFFRPGQICWMKHHESFNGGLSSPYTPALTLGSMMSLDQKTRSNISRSNQGDPIFTKGRPFIIIATFSDHFHALPMYTHENSGLSRVANINEHAYVRDHRRMYPADDRHQESPHKKLMTEHIPKEENLYSDNSTVHLTQLVSKRFDTPVHPVGRLTIESTKELLSLVTRYHMIAINASTSWCKKHERL